MATTTSVSPLRINYLTQAQYDAALANNTINANELYFTPSNGQWYGGISTAGTDAASWVVTINGITDSSSTNNGSLYIKGGLVVDKRLGCKQEIFLYRSGTGGGYYIYDTSGSTTAFRAHLSTMGTTSAIGVSTLQIGNATASGTKGNYKGQIKLYNSNAYCATIESAASSDRTWTIPAVGGNRYFVGKSSTNYTTQGVIYATDAQTTASTDVGAGNVVLVGGGTGAPPSWSTAPVIRNVCLKNESANSSLTIQYNNLGASNAPDEEVDSVSYHDKLGYDFIRARSVVGPDMTGYQILQRNYNNGTWLDWMTTFFGSYYKDGSVITSIPVTTFQVLSKQWLQGVAIWADGSGTTTGSGNGGTIRLYRYNDTSSYAQLDFYNNKLRLGNYSSGTYTTIMHYDSTDAHFHFYGYADDPNAVKTGVNNTWFAIGDDVYIGDHNVGGTLCIKAQNNYDPSIALFPYNDNDSTHAGKISWSYGTSMWWFKNTITIESPDSSQRWFAVRNADGDQKNLDVYFGCSGGAQGVYTNTYWDGNARTVVTGSGAWLIYRDGASYVRSTLGIKGAVWNDYAEYRATNIDEPGRVVIETQTGIMQLATERLMPSAKIISDTFGVAIGETEECKTPIAVSGRVLVYPYRNRDDYSLGAAVCSAPDGTVDIMTREEIMMYPERIIGTVSEIPNYEIWHAGSKEVPKDIEVNGRIWIYVR